jgi:hypothetical protein
MAMEKGKEPMQEEQKKKSQGGRCYFSKKPSGEAKQGIPTLKYGRSNNFLVFQQALYNQALRDYGDLAKLIKLNKYCEVTLEIPSEAELMSLTEEEVILFNKKAVIEYSQLKARMKMDRPKLYGLILSHMSMESKDEVAQDPDYLTWHTAADPKKLWQAIVRTHKVDCVSHVSQVQELAARKACQGIKQCAFELLA